ncbi:two-component system, OmpR family, sensor histidine kinase RstB [Andreprevotia lacus DSM 23236]|jgi:two-component system sensor histidine kinase RstB|uniref:histidine kinase n=1 Tax=Andreprevotia lacus DSM 23236 TaxID=1121001 RepID=A0A1W1XZ54_9NEIS|nr:ATP-binding protein [Andreprevotia lacus]SMC29155.1 two-component system, OmpR family, sensor histidine kinase RstB [Andreprevotia lacus DSM 23236]
MRRIFLRFYLTVVICFLVSSLLIGALYKHMIERTNEHYLSDIFQTTISIVESELGDLPQSLWHDEISRLRSKLPVPVQIEAIDAYTLTPANKQALADGDIILLEDQGIYLHRIPDAELMVALGPVPYLERIDNFSWPDWIALGLMCAALGLPTWLWLRPFWRDLLALIRQSRRFGAGEFGTRVALDDDSPLGPLGATFNRMAHDVEQLSSSRQAMIDAISHDVRTPLARLRYRLEAIKAGAPTPPQVEGIERDLNVIDQLIEEWLTLRRLEHQRFEMEMQPLEIVPWLERQLGELATGGDPVALRNLIPVKAPWLEADSYYLSRALGNLVSNARRYGKGHVSVTLDWRDGRILLMVDDDGPGIPVTARERLLQPFERLEGSRNVATGGYGLGLTIAGMVMHGHGGELRIDDAPGGGARVILTWPSPLKDASKLV